MFLVSGCDAPHSNSLDPASVGYISPLPPQKIADLTVTDISPLFALLSWTAPKNAIEYLLYFGPVGWDGIPNPFVTQYTGIIPGVKAAGTTQSLTISLPSSEPRVWSLRSRSLDGLVSESSNLVQITPPPRDRPGSLDAKAYSVYYSSWLPPDLIELSLEAAIIDTDGVDTVWASSDLGNLGRLLLTRDGVTWSKQIVERDIPTGVLERLIGHPIWINYRDHLVNETRFPPIYLNRVIYIPPIIEYPEYLEVVGPNPRLTWFPYNAEFLFTYGIDIVFVAEPSNIQTPIYRRHGISSDSLGHTIETNLAEGINGVYYWTLSVEDEFGDQAYSAESQFTVDDGN